MSGRPDARPQSSPPGGLRPRASALVLCAPSGSGKTTLANRLVAAFDRFEFSVSATTRAARVGERDGVDYHFVDERAFRKMAEADELAEWAEVHGRLYGTPRAGLEDAARRGRCLVLDIDVRGALLLRSAGADALLVFVLPPSVEAVVERLARRGSEGGPERRRRLRTALRELEAVSHFDEVVVNDELDRCVEDLVRILEGRRPGIPQEEVAERVGELRAGIAALVGELHPTENSAIF